MSINHRELCRQSISTLSEHIKSKKVSPVELVSAHLSCIEATEPLLNSFITLQAENALRAANESERQILNGNYLGPLLGIPYGLEDLFYTKGVRTTSGVKIYDEFTPSHDSTVARKLKQSGAILLGKLNCSQLAMGGGMGVNAYYGDTHNPWDRTIVPGGSSSGSASATSSGQVTFSLGTDTGGSIRIPAAFCGLVGFKPTYGLISRYGVTPLAWSLVHCGPPTRTVLDSALVLNAVSGWDVNDPASVKKAIQDYSELIGKPLSKLRIGVPKE